MSWARFAKEILPQALGLQVWVPATGSFTAFVGPTRDLAKGHGLFKWPNLYSWYLYPEASPCGQWGLAQGAWQTCLGVVEYPSQWDGPKPHLFEGLVLVLKGCRDASGQSAGLGLFPEILQAKLFPHRKTIEAYSAQGRLLPEGIPAAGLSLTPQCAAADLKVSLPGGLEVQVRIDRWY